MKAEKVIYKDTTVTFLWQLALFVITLNIGASIIQAVENSKRPNDVNNGHSREVLLREFALANNISQHDIELLMSDIESVEGNQRKEMSYAEAVMLTISLFYTVGWGHVIPTTVGGKILTMIVTVVGLPLTFLMTFTGAKLLLQLIKDVTLIILTHHYNGRMSKYGEQKVNKLAKSYAIPTVIAILIIYILVTSAAVAEIEGFSYFDSLWFCFITFSTIGLGDIYQGEMLTSEESRKVAIMFFIFIWLLLGYLIVAATLIIASETDVIHLREKTTKNNIFLSYKKEVNDDQQLLTSLKDNEFNSYQRSGETSQV